MWAFGTKMEEELQSRAVARKQVPDTMMAQGLQCQVAAVAAVVTAVTVVTS